MYPVPTGACNFEAISSSECPKNVMNVTGFSECSLGMDHNELCEAKTTLPDGNTNYNINNIYCVVPLTLPLMQSPRLIHCVVPLTLTRTLNIKEAQKMDEGIYSCATKNHKQIVSEHEVVHVKVIGGSSIVVI